MNKSKLFRLKRTPLGPDLNTQPLFSEEVDRRGWVKWGDDNLAPEKMIEYANKSAVHNRLLKDKAMMVGGNGFVKDGLSNATLNFLNNSYNEHDMDEILSDVSMDFEYFGCFSINLVWDATRTKITEVNYIPVSSVRIAAPEPGCDINDIKGYYISNRWDNPRKYPPIYVPTFSLTDRTSENTILFIKGKSKSNRFYGEPEYMAGMNWIEMEWKVGRFFNTGLSNGLQAGSIITFFGGIPSEDEQRSEAERLKAEFCGEENSQEPMIMFADNKDMAPVISPLPTNNWDSYFKDLRPDITDGILQAHRVSNGIIFGKQVAGKLGNKDEMLESLAIFQSNYITPRQRILEKVFNELLKINGIQDFLRIEKYSIEFNKVTAGIENTVSICSNDSLTPEQKYYILIYSGFEDKQSQQLSGFTPVEENNNTNG